LTPLNRGVKEGRTEEGRMKPKRYRGKNKKELKP